MRVPQSAATEDAPWDCTRTPTARVRVAACGMAERVRPDRAGWCAVFTAVLMMSGTTSAFAQEDGMTGQVREAVRMPEPTPVDPDAVLRGVDPDAVMTPERAAELQVAVREARADVRDLAVRERIGCYRRFFMNACLADVGRRERRADVRLDRIEIAANRRLREANALELNERAAVELEQRAAATDADSVERDANRRAYEDRIAASAAESARRAAEAPELERRGQANRAQRQQREAQATARRAEAAERAKQDASRAAARERELAEQRRSIATKTTQEAEQRERRKEDAARREAEARARAERPPARRSGGADKVPAPPAGDQLVPPPGDRPSR